MKLKNLNLDLRTLLAELVGTFILAIVAVTVGNPIITGFVLVVLVLALFTISGAHLNPAVTFGLWSVKRLEGIKVPFYWAAQVLGGLLALLTMQLFKSESFGLSLDSFGSFDAKLVSIEILGAAVFTFAIAAAIHKGLSDSAKSLAIGFGLLTGLAVGGGLLGQALQITIPGENDKTPRVTKVDGAIINPAIALAATEKDEQNAFTQPTDEEKSDDKLASRFTWETTVGALAGGALGMNLYFFLAGENPFKKQSVATKVVKKVKGKK